MIKKEDLGEWMANPVTRAYFAGIKDKILRSSLALGDGITCNTASVDETAIETAKMVGRIQGWKDALEIDTEEVLEEID